MGKKKKSKKKSSSHNSNYPSNDSVMKKEIEELKQKRGEIEGKAEEMKKGKGFWGKIGVSASAAIAKAKYNKQINDRANFIRAGKQIQNVRRQTELERAKTELQKARQERQKQVDFNKVNVDDLFKLN